MLVSSPRSAAVNSFPVRCWAPLVAHCHLGLGKLYRRTGKREQAQEHLTIATADVPRDGHDVLAGKGGGGDEGAGVRTDL